MAVGFCDIPGPFSVVGEFAGLGGAKVLDLEDQDKVAAFVIPLSVEENRLGISRWLLEKSSAAEGDCPVCGNELNATHSHLAELLTSLEEIEKGSLAFRTLPPSFEKEWVQVDSEIRKTTDSLTNVQKELKALQTVTDAERSRRYTELSACRFIGRIETGLSQYDRMNQDQALKTRLQELGDRIASLLREVDESVLEKKSGSHSKRSVMRWRKCCWRLALKVRTILQN
jgi:DNA repair exonuclease SbcCD ATPase subunit